MRRFFAASLLGALGWQQPHRHVNGIEMNSLGGRKSRPGALSPLSIVVDGDGRRRHRDPQRSPECRFRVLFSGEFHGGDDAGRQSALDAEQAGIGLDARPQERVRFSCPWSGQGCSCRVPVKELPSRERRVQVPNLLPPRGTWRADTPTEDKRCHAHNCYEPNASCRRHELYVAATDTPPRGSTIDRISL